MWQDIFRWIWLVLTIAIIVVRKMDERRSGQHTGLKGTPAAEATLMVLWGVAASIIPLIYMFRPWLDFADWSIKPPPLLGFTGMVLFLLAIWLLHRSHADLGKQWSPSVEPSAMHPLVMEGVYRRIRHPMYTAHLLWGVAQALLLPNLIAGPGALLILVILLGVRVPREERALIGEYGDQYRRYMLRTGRFFPKMRT